MFLGQLTRLNYIHTQFASGSVTVCLSFRTALALWPPRSPRARAIVESQARLNLVRGLGSLPWTKLQPAMVVYHL